MSQQINLLVPELRPKRDWLDFHFVMGAALAGVLVVAAQVGWGSYQIWTLTALQSRTGAEMQAVQQQLPGLGQALSARKSNTGLQAEIQRLGETLQQREAVLRMVEESKAVTGAWGYADIMRGFARQLVEGVWLTGFTASGNEMEIRGRLTDPALLPQYIHRLNAEETFRGRHFGALEMKEEAAAGDGATPVRPGKPRYADFILRSSAEKPEEKQP